jgi:hypothetical protein
MRNLRKMGKSRDPNFGVDNRIDAQVALPKMPIACVGAIPWLDPECNDFGLTEKSLG